MILHLPLELDLDPPRIITDQNILGGSHDRKQVSIRLQRGVLNNMLQCAKLAAHYLYVWGPLEEFEAQRAESFLKICE